LFCPKAGGYRLNTDFKENDMNLGRMFGFAYGHKENGAVFSHMTVMYAYALYSRNFIKEGYQAIKALADQSLDFGTSFLYPGIPEYFSPRGRGMYPYLTGAASWLILTVLTQMFGITGEKGNLKISPKLLAEQFGEEGIAEVNCRFAGRKLNISYINKQHKEIGDYEVESIYINGKIYPFQHENPVIERSYLENLPEYRENSIRIILE